MDKELIIQNLTMLYLQKYDSTKNLLPKELVEKYFEVFPEIKDAYQLGVKSNKVKTLDISKLGL